MKNSLVLSVLHPAILWWATGGASVAAPQIPTMNGLPLVFSEDFQKGAQRWEPTDPAAWKTVEENGHRVFSLFQASNYQPPVRSPHNIALLKGLWLSDFVLEAKVKSTTREYGHRDLCFIFGWQDPSHFYYAHLASAADANAHSVFVVNGQPRVSIAGQRTGGVKWVEGRYHTVRIVRDTKEGTIKVYFDDLHQPVITATDKTFAFGRIGLGSFDDTGNFDDIRVWGNQADPLPEFYKKVGRVSWIVDDLEKVTQAWSRLGFPPLEKHGDVELGAATFKGQPANIHVRAASGRMGDVEVDWIQPLGGKNAFTEFLTRHGSGIFSLMHRVATLEALERELERLARLGVGILQQGEFNTDAGPVRYAYLDTVEEGKYALGLIYSAGPVGGGPLPSSQRTPFNQKLAQFAFVIRDPEPVSTYWSRLGFPEISITHGALRNRRYRDQPGQFDHNLGWQRHGAIVYEWCIPLQGPTAYEDHLKAHGDGFHHLAFQVDDIDGLISGWTALGFPPVQSGAWGEEGKKGSGRFAYMGTDPIGGVTIEFLWSLKE